MRQMTELPNECTALLLELGVEAVASANLVVASTLPEDAKEPCWLVFLDQWSRAPDSQICLRADVDLLEYLIILINCIADENKPLDQAKSYQGLVAIGTIALCLSWRQGCLFAEWERIIRVTLVAAQRSSTDILRRIVDVIDWLSRMHDVYTELDVPQDVVILVLTAIRCRLSFVEFELQWTNTAVGSGCVRSLTEREYRNVEMGMDLSCMLANFAVPKLLEV